MARLICLLIGYCCGLLQTGYLYGKYKGIDIRTQGSGNSGATNTLRVLGKQAGLIVFLGDMLKCLIPCVVVRFFFQDRPGFEGMTYAMILYMGLGVILGHNFPFYMNFKGGKGIACMAGLIIGLDWRLLLISIVVFFGAVLITRFVSLGSILVAAEFFAVNAWFAYRGDYRLSEQGFQEFLVLLAIISLMAVWRHRANIGRLLSGTENKLWGGKKKEA